nr:MAG TPA: hypothetical protein [Caudoviricetes sp.]
MKIINFIFCYLLTTSKRILLHIYRIDFYDFPIFILLKKYCIFATDMYNISES